ncbi:hypothetical protein KIN20_021930 [Parelaphostrongylus tenuis]|uniref:Uncharacterized protein n=1 Tax=Parelaphostrongylus tenuis TaxID=148309 RepID=A0AAD5QV11_PARTN|nr:hypothetical protein KIN20_021930 [Parelaphostrongylus tenuis]
MNPETDRPLREGAGRIVTRGHIATNALGQAKQNDGENMLAKPINKGVRTFCRFRNVPMVYETLDRAYKAVHELCTESRDVLPVAAQTSFSSINSFIRDAANRRSANRFFCFCGWHYAQESFDWSEHLVSPMLPSQINALQLLENHQKGLIFPDPYCIAPFSLSEDSSTGTTCAFFCTTLSCTSSARCFQLCVVCNKVPAYGPLCNAMNTEYMIPVPLDHAHRERWATHITYVCAQPNSSHVIESFDDTSLCTNVSDDPAIAKKQL